MPDYSQHARKEQPEYRPSAEPSRIYLVLAAGMIGLAIVGYAFEDRLADTATDWPFLLFGLITPVLLALFCLYCYRNAEFGNRILGRYVELDLQDKDQSGVTYDIFQGENPADVKAVHRRRKSARAMRKKLARETRADSSGDADESPREDKG